MRTDEPPLLGTIIIMPRLLMSLAMLLAPLLVFGVPVPKAQKFEKFGTVVEAPGVTCELAKPGELRVVASKEGATGFKAHFVARPLVTHKIEGDFDLTVRITHTPPAGKDVATVGDQGDPIVSAGIALSSPDDPKVSVVFLHRYSKEGERWANRFLMFTRFAEKGSDSSTADENLPQQPIYLRLTRRGEEFTSAKSVDGEQWSSIFTHTIPGLGSVSVGPVAMHNTNARYEVKFDEYVLKPLKKEKK